MIKKVQIIYNFFVFLLYDSRILLQQAKNDSWLLSHLHQPFPKTVSPAG